MCFKRKRQRVMLPSFPAVFVSFSNTFSVVIHSYSWLRFLHALDVVYSFGGRYILLEEKKKRMNCTLYFVHDDSYFDGRGWRVRRSRKGVLFFTTIPHEIGMKEEKRKKLPSFGVSRQRNLHEEEGFFLGISLDAVRKKGKITTDNKLKSCSCHFELWNHSSVTGCHFCFTFWCLPAIPFLKTNLFSYHCFLLTVKEEEGSRMLRETRQVISWEDDDVVVLCLLFVQHSHPTSDSLLLLLMMMFVMGRSFFAFLDAS